MFGSISTNLPQSVRNNAQEKVDKLKSERSSVSPFGIIADDVENMASYKEQFLKSIDRIRCKSLRELIRFLEKKVGPDNAFASLNRYPDEHGTAIWTTLQNESNVKIAIKRRSEERLQETICQWTGNDQTQINKVRTDLKEEKRKISLLEEALKVTKNKLEKSIRNVSTLENKVLGLEESLDTTKQQLDETKQQLSKCGRDLDEEKSVTPKNTIKNSGVFKVHKKKNKSKCCSAGRYIFDLDLSDLDV